MTIHACSSNRGKLDEFLAASHASGLADLTIEPLPGWTHIAAPDESGTNFEENAVAKAIYYSGFTDRVVLADDSGLEVAALDGAPGIHSARFAGPNATDVSNNELLLHRLRNHIYRVARFVCFLALARAGNLLTSFKGIVEGEILQQPRGHRGFGYDPLFFYPPLSRTFAELTSDEKFAVSHRGHALRSLFTYLSYSTREDCPGSAKIG